MKKNQERQDKTGKPRRLKLSRETIAALEKPESLKVVVGRELGAFTSIGPDPAFPPFCAAGVDG